MAMLAMDDPPICGKPFVHYKVIVDDNYLDPSEKNLD